MPMSYSAPGGGTIQVYPFIGDGSDGSVTISSNTDLGSANNKQYANLTINANVSLTGNTDMTTRISGTLTYGNSSSSLNVDGKGAVGSINNGAGGDGQYLGNIISGTGASTDGAGAGGASFGYGGGSQGGTNTVVLTTNRVTSLFLAIGTYGAGGSAIDGTTGANGGGGLVVIVNAISGTGIISASGIPATGISKDSGGGGGGCVTVICYSVLPAMKISANGGNGQYVGGTYYGGGGGGGAVIIQSLNSSAATITASGGASSGGSSGAGTNGIVGQI